MDKILQTQMNNIYNQINAQEEEVETAARLLAQAVHGEGRVVVKTFHDFTKIEPLLTQGELKLGNPVPFSSLEALDTPDRVLVVANTFDEEVRAFTETLYDNAVEFALISNYNRHEAETIDSFHHYIDLSSPRPLIPTPAFDKIVNPYINAFTYIYYHLYVLIDEMTNEEY
ncbi:DUF2529 family protein [Salinicoccus kekensis]|uniref:Uncharacterized protein DUF2529 n=1 Tax=Salinicoccus kekensis TaxID=714307 RepID=A0A285ULH4_9STAP|nr:DUF2529 family protein [Salinicoccus kekensis]SOC42745.1 uncharacterized protein DUF2529 [Salinicoccus kekensis]